MMKDELGDKLQILCKKLNADNKFFKKLLVFTNNRIAGGKLSDVFDDRKEINTYLTKNELYWLAKGIYTLGQKNNKLSIKDLENINPICYFTDTEIQTGESFYIPKNINEVNKNRFIIEEIKQVDDNEWIAVVDYKTIYRAMIEGFSRYNFDTQREAKAVQEFGEVYLKPFVDYNTVDNIYKKMKQRKFFKNCITWNILSTGDEEFSYDKNREKLVFIKKTGSYIDIIDGFHRTLAIVKLLSETDKINDKIFIHLVNFTVQQAQELIAQENEGNKISNTRKKYLTSNRFTSLVKRINREGSEETNVLFNKITEVLDEIKYNKKIIYAPNFMELLEDCYKNKLTKANQINIYTKWLVEYFNELDGVLGDVFSNIEDNKKKNVLLTQNTFAIYIKLSSLIYGKDNWRDELENFMKKFNWDKNNTLWQKIHLTSKRNDKRVRNTLYKFVEENYVK